MVRYGKFEVTEKRVLAAALHAVNLRSGKEKWIFSSSRQQTTYGDVLAVQSFKNVQ